MRCSRRRLIVTLANNHSKRVIAGSFILLFWIGITAIRHLHLSTEAWASWVPLRCPLLWLFDISCPTCGLGRSLIAAAMGHGHESFRYHPLGLPLFWGSQGILLTWIFWPKGWAALQLRCQHVCRRNRPLLWLLILLYSVWGFCWRSQV